MDDNYIELKDKKTPEVVVSEVGRDDSHGDSSFSPAGEWAPGWKRRTPWFGFGALFAVVLCSIGQMLILLFADQRAASDWIEYLSPNVCLSILNGISSLAITFAVMQGIAIAWWRKALSGASIKELHYTWNFSTSITTILTKFKYFNAIALAALMTKVAIIDGVLYQRAMSTYIAISWQQVAPGSVGDSPVFAWSKDTFPVTGNMGAQNNGEGQSNTRFSITTMNWVNTGSGLNAYDLVSFCYGVGCDYGLPGAGFQIECDYKNSSEPFVDNAAKDVGPKNQTIFEVDFTLVDPDSTKNYSRIKMEATWPIDAETSTDGLATCPTLFTTASCELRPAAMNYTVFYTNASSVERSKLEKVEADNQSDQQTIGESGSRLGSFCSLRNGGLQPGYTEQRDDCGLYSQKDKQIVGVEIRTPIDLYEPWQAGGNSSLIGIYNAMRDQLKARAVLEYQNGSWAVAETGYLSTAQSGYKPPEEQNCNYTYMDPQETIFASINRLMLMTSVDPSLWGISQYDEDGSQVYNQNVQALQYFKDIYYDTDYVFMGVALGLTLLVIICIIPSYWGFWQLGRDVTLGPFEIAYAFQGPAFQSVVGVNGNADQVVRTVGRTKVQYGEVEDESGKRLAFKMA